MKISYFSVYRSCLWMKRISDTKYVYQLKRVCVITGSHHNDGFTVVTDLSITSCYHRALEYNYSCRDTLHTLFLSFPHSPWRDDSHWIALFKCCTSIKCFRSALTVDSPVCLRAPSHVTHTPGVPEPPWEEPRTQTLVSKTLCDVCSFALWVWTQMRCVQLLIWLKDVSVCINE